MQANTRGTRGISVPQVGGWRKRERGLGERDGGGMGVRSILTVREAVTATAV